MPRSKVITVDKTEIDRQIGFAQRRAYEKGFREAMNYMDIAIVSIHSRLDPKDVLYIENLQRVLLECVEEDAKRLYKVR